jgi:diguanylate cyclase (GGDEF)-like protein
MSSTTASPLLQENVTKEPSAPRMRARHWVITILIAGAAIIGFIAAADELFLPRDKWPVWLVVCSSAAGVAAWGVTLGDRRRIRYSLTRLTRLVREIHGGDAPIDQLNSSPDVLQPIAEQFQEVLRDLRQQKQAIAKLNEEIKQRIANRTSALERLVETLRHQATRDALTGLHNRRMLDEILPQLVRQCLADGVKLSLLMMDLDDFRQVNDVLGHVTGDEMLKSLGQIIHSALRSHDAAFRYGGDEFVVLLPNCDGPSARIVTARLQGLVQAMVKNYKLPRPPRLTIGICTLAELAVPSAQNLLKGADEQLYAAKSNRATPLPPPVKGVMI